MYVDVTLTGEVHKIRDTASSAETTMDNIAGVVSKCCIQSELHYVVTFDRLADTITVKCWMTLTFFVWSWWVVVPCRHLTS